MFSPTLKKPIFIDFGLATFVKEMIGQKTLTGFSGSLKFCTEEMARCCLAKEDQYIDLYFNDLYGLTESLKLVSKD